MTVTIDGSTGVSLVQDGVIQQADLSSAIVPLGVGQTWQWATGLRTSGVAYTNTTGRPIFVVVVATSAVSGVNSISAVVNGVTAGYQYVPAVTGLQTAQSVSFIVPAGSVYTVTYNNTATWAEVK